MNTLNNIVLFFKDEEGLTVVEYVIGAALLVLALVGVFSALRDGLSASLSNTLNNLPSTLSQP
ncbi:Flp family type IVb pilin [Vibrio breoganii]|uniref:Flp family type IVb pilin n=1 Tax=Vibrio breoganii TaxID=553239 RepID=UPI0021C4B825|nr:Flp family type IVb pilin [Vibrio breoganii]MDN3717478.1 Flp family type IVb pilin [Vibrio breoganii]